MTRWWWLGVAAGVGVLVVVAVWQAGKTSVEAPPVSPSPTPPVVVETESTVAKQGQLVENQPGTAKIGYSLVMADGEQLYLDLSHFSTASTAAYLNRTVTVKGPILRRTWDDQTETRFMLVQEITESR